MNLKLIIRLMFVLFTTEQLFASPWIEPGDVWLRADIEYLADRGIIHAPITTWPIMWSSIKKDVDHALNDNNLYKLSQREQTTLLTLKRRFRVLTSKASSVTLSAASEPEVLRGFTDTPREKGEIEFSKSAMGESWAYQINVQYLYEPYVSYNQQKESTRFDGSFIAAIYNNVSLSYGYVDKWWGPGWDSSLILTNNARSNLGIMLQRNYSDAFESDWLSWIGPWTFNVFANQLDDERHIADANLLGMSITFKPFSSLEIGLRRTAQWGGEGRPDDLSSLIDLFIGNKDNCYTADCRAEEPGNQLAAIDVRWRLPTELPISMYFQTMGEDEAGYAPSKKTFLLGVSANIVLFDFPVKSYFEFSDTSIDFGNQFNVAYNHSIYRTGYRYLGRNIASTYDNDTESYVFGMILPLSLKKKLFFQLSNIKLNRDNIGKHSINTNNINFSLISALYRQEIKYGRLDLFFNQYSDIIDENMRQKNETRIGASWTMSFH